MFLNIPRTGSHEMRWMVLWMLWSCRNRAWVTEFTGDERFSRDVCRGGAICQKRNFGFVRNQKTTVNVYKGSLGTEIYIWNPMEGTIFQWFFTIWTKKYVRKKYGRFPIYQCPLYQVFVFYASDKGDFSVPSPNFNDFLQKIRRMETVHWTSEDWVWWIFLYGLKIP